MMEFTTFEIIVIIIAVIVWLTMDSILRDRFRALED